MKKRGLVGGAILLVVLVAGAYYIAKPLVENRQFVTFATPTPEAPIRDMRLSSFAFENYQAIPKAYTCDGKKIHPPLTISNVPEGTKSLAIILDDPDAPGGIFNHWVMWNIDPKTTQIPEGEIPNLAQEGTNTAGREDYVPPCPPKGQHRYFFTLYALDTTIGLDGKAKKPEVENAMQGHVLSQSLLIGVYGR